ncbi:glycosyltransferase [Rubrobacter calidifluminis]|uniref:glycosyltransferase n=1 Tax=Rubrobacter calidifluminis TaxID=1392640 RepID=UPI002362C29F|nr:glycosyltransferase [Rubrobacter calidifluminis]
MAHGKPLLTLVVPTRDEAENVRKLARRLDENLSGIDYRLLFVDDSSDETPGIILEMSRHDPRIRLIRREEHEREGGLSTAVTTGMEAAEESVYTCVMDADLQHPPEKVREMLEVARTSGADVVVASRYAPGGDYAGLSGPVRRGVSWGSRFLARMIFKEARKTTDPMTGFFLLRNEAISGIQFRPKGFKILLEILVCAPDLKVVELPFRFQARNAGVSKATVRQGFDYLAHIASLFWYVPSAGRFWKFALVGASGVLVNMVTLIVLAEILHADKVIAWMFGVGVSILSNFLLNNAFTWRDVRHSSRIHFLLRGALAYPVAIIGIGANFAVYYPLIKYVSDAFPYYVIFNFFGIAAATAVNFILSSRLIFRPPSPRTLDPEAPPEQATAEIKRELRAERAGLIVFPERRPLGEHTPEPQEEDLETIELAIRRRHPILALTGPTRPQPRTNTRWANTLAVPVVEGGEVLGALYASRRSTEPFTEDDLQWLTSYAIGAPALLRSHPRATPQESHLRTRRKVPGETPPQQ